MALAYLLIGKCALSISNLANFKDIESKMDRDCAFNPRGAYNSIVCCSGMVYGPLNIYNHIGGSICHASFGTDLKNKQDIKYVLSSLWYTGNKECAEAWWSYIFDHKRSPWRGCLKEGSYERFGNWFALKVEEDTNPQLLFNLIVASRNPFEHQDKVKAWHTMVKGGVSESFATLLYGTLFSLVKESKSDNISFFLRGYLSGHFPFSCRDKEDFLVMYERIKNASPLLNGHNMKGQRAIYPSNVIWSDKNKNVINGSYKDLKETYGDNTHVWLKELFDKDERLAEAKVPTRKRIFDKAYQILENSLAVLDNKSSLAKPVVWSIEDIKQFELKMEKLI